MRVRRPWLLPLVPLYAAGLRWKNRTFDRNPSRAQRLAAPVISVGSLSAGGAGKTPFLIALGEMIRQHLGWNVDVLSRGYGRSSGADQRVDPEGEAAQFGDEPLLIARALGCPVYVGRERFRAGRLAEAGREPHDAAVHLLDDGFQHRQLARSVDLVLLTAQDVEDTLLPAGNLREPLHALHRADVVVVRADEQEALLPVLGRVFAGRPLPPVWSIERRFAVVEGHASSRPLAFCALARPESFEASLAAAGVAPARFLRCRDHHAYTDQDIARLVRQAHAAGADGFVTTAKDAVKLTAPMRQVLYAAGPLAVGDLRVVLQDPAAYAAGLRALLGRGAPESGGR